MVGRSRYEGKQPVQEIVMHLFGFAHGGTSTKISRQNERGTRREACSISSPTTRWRSWRLECVQPTWTKDVIPKQASRSDGPPRQATVHRATWLVPRGSFLTKRCNFFVKALYKLCERRWKSSFRLHSPLLPCVLNALHKPLEKTLLCLFVGKLLKGLMRGSAFQATAHNAAHDASSLYWDQRGPGPSVGEWPHTLPTGPWSEELLSRVAKTTLARTRKIHR